MIGQLSVVKGHDDEHESTQGPPEALMDLKQTAKFLGVAVSWVYERTRRDAIPHLKLGRYVRFRRADVEDWLRSGDSASELGALPEPTRRKRTAPQGEARK